MSCSAEQLRARFHRDGDRFQGALEIGDRHPDLVDVVIAQGRGQLGARQGGMGGQLHRRRLVLERRLFVEELVDPDRQGERRPIEAVILEAVGRRAAILRVGACSSSSELDSSASIASTSSLQVVAVEQLGPTHLARDDLVALRMIEILLEQLHVLLRLVILLLEKTLPLVLVPHAIGLVLVPGHTLI